MSRRSMHARSTQLTAQYIHTLVALRRTPQQLKEEQLQRSQLTQKLQQQQQSKNNNSNNSVKLGLLPPTCLPTLPTPITYLTSAITLLTSEKNLSLTLDYDQRELVQQHTDGRRVVHDVMSATIHAIETLEQPVRDRAAEYNPTSGLKHKILHHYHRVRTPVNSTQTAHRKLIEALWALVRKQEYVDSGDEKRFNIRTNRYSGSKSYRQASVFISHPSGKSQGDCEQIEYACDTVVLYRISTANNPENVKYADLFKVLIEQYNYDPTHSLAHGNTLLHTLALSPLTHASADELIYLLNSPHASSTISSQNEYSDTPLHLLLANLIDSKSNGPAQNEVWKKLVQELARIMTSSEDGMGVGGWSEKEMIRKYLQQQQQQHMKPSHHHPFASATSSSSSISFARVSTMKRTSTIFEAELSVTSMSSPSSSSSAHAAAASVQAASLAASNLAHTRLQLALAMYELSDRRAHVKNTIWVQHHRNVMMERSSGCPPPSTSSSSSPYSVERQYDQTSALTVKHVAGFIDKTRFKFLSQVSMVYDLLDQEKEEMEKSDNNNSNNNNNEMDQQHDLQKQQQAHLFRDMTRAILQPIFQPLMIEEVLIPDLANIVSEYLV